MTITKFTENMMGMLPRWMKMAKDPESVGAQFLDAFGVEFQDVASYLEHSLNNQFIGQANLGDIDFCYKVPLALPKVLDMDEIRVEGSLIIEGKKIPMHQVFSLKRFYEDDESVCIVDRQEGYLYVKPNELIMERDIFHPVDAISVDGTNHYEYNLHHIWNVFDEFGLLLGLYRLSGERNAAFKERILDVFRNPANSSKQGLVNGISRELGLAKDQVKLGSLAHPEFYNTMFNPDGTPTKYMMDYVDKINSSLGFSWDNMNWGEAYWRSLEEKNMGFYYLPHIWDGFSPEWKNHEIQSGIGSGDDLKVEKPREEESIRKFKAYVGLRGTDPNVENLYPEVRFKYKITAKGKIPNQEYKMEDYKYTVIASELIKLSYILTATKQFLYETKIDWIKNTYEFEDPASPGMEIVTGEDVLHKQTDKFVQLHVEMTSSDRKGSPSLQDITVDWVDDANGTHSFTLSTAEDFTQKNAIVSTDFKDTFATETGEVELGFGDFYAVVDTEGAFMQGTRDMSVVIQRNGSITLDI